MTQTEFKKWLKQRRAIATGKNAEGRGGDAIRVLMASVELEHAVLSDRDAEIALLGFRLALNEAAFSRKAFVKDGAKRHRKQRDDTAVNEPRNIKIADGYVKRVGGDPSRTPGVVAALATAHDLNEASIRRILKARGVFLRSR